MASVEVNVRSSGEFQELHFQTDQQETDVCFSTIVFLPFTESSQKMPNFKWNLNIRGIDISVRIFRLG